jgi:anti-sigma regulatory factor (Ser/Thr protein kinase)
LDFARMMAPPVQGASDELVRAGADGYVDVDERVAGARLKAGSRRRELVRTADGLSWAARSFDGTVPRDEPRTAGLQPTPAGMADDDALLRLDLPDRAQAPAAARKALTALNGSLHLISEARLRDAQLLVSELVANAVRYGAHSSGKVKLTVHAAPDSMRVEVTDDGPGLAVAQLPMPSLSAAAGGDSRSSPRWRTAGESSSAPQPPRSGSRSTGRDARRRFRLTPHRLNSSTRPTAQVHRQLGRRLSPVRSL